MSGPARPDDESLAAPAHDHLSITPGPFVHLAILDHLLRVAIESILRLERLIIVNTAMKDNEDVFILTDDLQREGERVVLLTDESPAEAYAAVAAFTSGRVRAVASIRRPEAIPLVMNAAYHHLAVLPSSLLSAAFEAPRLRDRQVRILALTIEGLTNSSIGARLGLSEATVKRNVTALLRAFNCTTRTELVRRASNVGFTTTSRTLEKQR